MALLQHWKHALLLKTIPRGVIASLKLMLKILTFPVYLITWYRYALALTPNTNSTQLVN